MIFGLHAAGGGAQHVQYLGAKYVRRIVKWNEIETSPGVFNWTPTDNEFNSQQDAGNQLVFTLRPVGWGVDISHVNEPDTGWSGIPNNRARWYSFVKKVVERYLTVVHYQFDNEPRHQWKSTSADYNDLLIGTSNAIKMLKPRAKIIVGGITGLLGAIRNPTVDDMNYLKNVKRTLSYARDAYDIVDYHAYDDEPASVKEQVDWLRNETDKPIWTLENAGPFSYYNVALHADHVIKRYTLAFLHGVEAMFWSSLNPTTMWDERYQRLALLDKPAYKAYRLLTTKLQGSTELKFAHIPGVSVDITVIKALDTLYIAWSNNTPKIVRIGSATPIKITYLNGSTEIVQPLNGMVTFQVSRPIFIEG